MCGTFLVLNILTDELTNTGSASVCNMYSIGEVQLPERNCETMLQNAQEMHAVFTQDTEMLHWAQIASSKTPTEISTVAILRSQLGENMDPQKVIPRLLEAQSANGKARFFQLQGTLDATFGDFLRHRSLAGYLRMIPTKTTKFDFKPSQILFILYQVYGSMMIQEPAVIRLRYDATCSSNKPAVEGDEMLTEISCAVPAGGGGIDFINCPTGTGKKVCALAVLVLRLGVDKLWKWVLKHKTMLLNRARTKSAGNGFCVQHTSGVAELLRLAIVRCTSLAVQDHFQSQLAILLPCIMPHLSAGVSLEIWCDNVNEELKAVCAALHAVRLLRGGSIATAMSMPDGTAVIWFMSMDAKHNQNLRLNNGMPADPWAPLPCNCIIPFELLDEMREASAPLLEDQDPVVFYRLVTNMTPVKIIAESKFGAHHWFHNVIPGQTAAVMRGLEAGSREDIRKGLVGVLMMSLLATPLSLVHMLATDFIEHLPGALIVCPIRTRSSKMIPDASNRDDMSRTSLYRWIHAQFGWQLLLQANITGGLAQLEAVCGQCVAVDVIRSHVAGLIAMCTALTKDYEQRNVYKVAKTTIAQLERFSDLLTHAHECPICMEPCDTAELCILTCCATGLCNVCLHKISSDGGSSKCPTCRIPLSNSVVVDAIAIANAHTAADDNFDVSKLLYDFSVQSTGGSSMTTNEALYEIWRCMLRGKPNAHVLLVCEDADKPETEQRINDLLGDEPRGKVAHAVRGLTSDCALIRQYNQLTDYPMMLLLPNEASSDTLSELDVCNTDAILSLKIPEDVGKLVGRVFRPSRRRADRKVPLGILC